MKHAVIEQQKQMGSDIPQMVSALSKVSALWLGQINVVSIVPYLKCDVIELDWIFTRISLERHGI